MACQLNLCSFGPRARLACLQSISHALRKWFLNADEQEKLFLKHPVVAACPMRQRQREGVEEEEVEIGLEVEITSLSFLSTLSPLSPVLKGIS